MINMNALLEEARMRSHKTMGSPELKEFVVMVEGELKQPKKLPSHDPILTPKHYQLLPNVEVIDVRKALLDKMWHWRGTEGNMLTFEQVDFWSRSWEYLTRAFMKNGVEDLKKCRVYLDWLIASLEGKK